MPADQPSPSRPLARQNPMPVSLRFSMRTLMAIVTLAALWFGVCAALPGVLSNLLIGGLWLVVTGWLLTGLVFARGDARAFCIGAVVVMASAWTGFGGQFLQAFQSIGFRLTGGVNSPLGSLQSDLLAWLKHLVLFSTAIGNGYLCIRARRYFEPESP
ncbi:MAG: hypothetical protein KDA57_14510 [Planctomycetales bacterium]|nr:hypothetical protein [Planctomycetales bacterium]